MDLALSLFTTGPAPPASFARQPAKYPSTTPNHFLSLLLFNASTSFPTASLISQDVLKNFQYLRKAFENVYAMMVRERSQCQFVILCPIDQSLMGKNELSGAEWEWGGIDEDFVTSHIVRIPHREKPETRHILPTANGRSLIVTDTTVTTAKGFRQLKQARLVAEKIVYDNDGRGWIVYLIDRPLIGVNQEMPRGLQAAASAAAAAAAPSPPPSESRRTSYSPPDRTPAGSPSVQQQASQPQPSQHPPQASQFQRLPTAERLTARRSPRPSTDESGSVRRTSLESMQSSASVAGGAGSAVRRSRLLTGYQYPSYQSWTNARGAYALVHHAHRAPRAPLALPTVLQRFPGLSARLEQTVMTFNDETMFKSDLDEIRASIDQLLGQVVEMLNQLDPNLLLGVLKDHNMSVDGLNLLVEDYVLNSTYDIVFFKITLQLKQQDWELAEAIQELQHLDLAQVGLADTLTQHRSLVSALNEFQSIGILRTPKEKLQCLVRYVRVTSALSGGGADDLIPILLLTILRSGISNLASNLHYMKHFVLFGDPTSGEYGYSLSTLEAVSRYIHSHAKQLAPLSRLNQEYWQSVKDGHLDKVTQMREDSAVLDMTAKALLTAPPTSSRRASEASLTKPESTMAVAAASLSSDHGQHQAPIASLPPPPALPPPPPSSSPHSSATIKAAPYNSRDGQGNPDVMMACKANQKHVLEFLLDRHHVPANVANFEGTSLLMQAVETEQREMVEMILRRLTQERDSSTCDTQKTELGSRLPPAGRRRRQRQREGEGEGGGGGGGEEKDDTDEASQENGLNHQNVHGQTAVHICVERGNLELLNLLLEYRVDLTLANNDGDSPLILASKLTEKDLARYRPIVERLVEAMSTSTVAATTTIATAAAAVAGEGDFDQVNNHGDSAFHYLSDPWLISLLAAKGANPDVDNYAGWTPLLKWALHDDSKAVQSLIRTGKVDYLMTDSRGYTALHMACLRGNVDMVRMLLLEEDDQEKDKDKEEEVKSKVKEQGGTAVDGDKARKTIRYRMPVDLQSLMDGATPLQLACQSGAVPVVELLLQMGANPQLRDWANEFPSDMTSDTQILELLDNASLFWDSQLQQRQLSSLTAPVAKEEEEEQGTRRVIRVVRGAVGRQGRVQYIVKSGSSSSPSKTATHGSSSGRGSQTVVTMERSLEDFKFLRKCLLIEYPDICIPSLEGFYSPFLLSPSRPSKIVMAGTARRLDMFLNYLSDHPLLKDHELLWEFMLMPELQKEMISRSQRKQESALDTIYDSFSHHVDHLENEEEYFKMLQQTMMQLDRAIKQAQCSARKLHRSIQDVPQQLENYAHVLEHADQVDWNNKSNYLQALRAITATQSKMHTSDIESIGNLFEDFSFVVEGTLRALQHPQETIASIRTLRKSYERMQRAQKRSEALWQGLSTIGEGALSAIGGAGAAIGAAGQAATSFALTTVGVADRTSLSSSSPPPISHPPGTPAGSIDDATAATAAAIDVADRTSVVAAPVNESTGDTAAASEPSMIAPPPLVHPSSSPGRRSGHGRAVSSSPSFRSLSTLPVKDLSPSAPPAARSATLSRATGGKTGVVSRGGRPGLAPDQSVGTITTTTTTAAVGAITSSASSPLSFFANAPSLSFLPLPSFSFGTLGRASTTSPATTTTTATAETSTASGRGSASMETGMMKMTTAERRLREAVSDDAMSMRVGQQQQQHHQHEPSSSSTMSSSLSSPSESALEELEMQMSRASSLLNAMHGSLANELAHLQHHHTQALERAMRDFGARQLKIERSRLRDMMEILSELRVQLGPDEEEEEEEEEEEQGEREEQEEDGLLLRDHGTEADGRGEKSIDKRDTPVSTHERAAVRVVAGSGRVRGSGPRNLYGWVGASNSGEHGERQVTHMTLDAVLSMQQQQQYRAASVAGGDSGHFGRGSGGGGGGNDGRRYGGGNQNGLLGVEDDEKAELKLLQRQMEIQQCIDESLLERSLERRGKRLQIKEEEEEEEEEQQQQRGLGKDDDGQEDSLSEKVSME